MCKTRSVLLLTTTLNAVSTYRILDMDINPANDKIVGANVLCESLRLKV